MKVVFTTFSVLTLGGILALSGCSGEGNRGGSTGRSGPGGGRNGGPVVAEAVPVEVEAAQTGPIASFLSFNSTIEVENAVDVFPETGGLVEELLVEEGDRVTAGDPLLRLDHDEQLVELKESEVNLTHLESSFQRTEDLFDRGLINQQDFDTKTLEFAQARLRLERAKIMVERATVRAPVNSVVTERIVQPGARVSAGTKVFGLMSLDDMIALVHVPGRYLMSVREGQEANLASEFLPGREFGGWVKRISPIVDPSSGTFKVTVGLVPSGEPPPPGLFVNVRIVTDRRQDAVLIPKRAVVYEGGERYAFTVADGVASKVRLDVGYEEGEFVQVLSRVFSGDAIVVLGQNALKDQATVRIVPTNQPTSAIAGSPHEETPTDS